MKCTLLPERPSKFITKKKSNLSKIIPEFVTLKGNVSHFNNAKNAIEILQLLKKNNVIN